ncbi:hypothetical protein SAMN05444851_1186 [Aliiroseovarius sediminilitoris]|uniref:Flp pilus assembly protein, pilin Flp n=2 Tax=Aliiroseovarius sediminilitoris TaxID=1173584 RepID=A0A1I0NZM0_9RHOB|nr:hypothetical protein SAMN05444851_1186 [Aliiroseovarius sediminilitoris]
MEQLKNIFARISGLITDEDGAVTVDWVVLTASIVMLGMASMFIVAGNIPGLTEQISSVVANQSVGS